MKANPDSSQSQLVILGFRSWELYVLTRIWLLGLSLSSNSDIYMKLWYEEVRIGIGIENSWLLLEKPVGSKRTVINRYSHTFITVTLVMRTRIFPWPWPQIKTSFMVVGGRVEPMIGTRINLEIELKIYPRGNKNIKVASGCDLNHQFLRDSTWFSKAYYLLQYQIPSHSILKNR